MFQGLENAEDTLAAFCADHGVPFVSVVDALRERSRSGKQVYYTYDQHWTPLGHQAVTAALAPRLREYLEVARSNTVE